MRIPITRYGLPQVVIYPLAILVAMVVYALIAGPRGGRALWAVEAVLLVLLAWSLSFFRDPYRAVPQDDRLLLAPADGTVMDVETVDEADFISGPALRIGIFLSIFNVHINRCPCAARVEKITYRRGKFVNAMNPLAGKINESNDVALVRLASLAPTLEAGGGRQEAPATSKATKLLVRQISGAIARRIVCSAREGQVLAAGEPFGMIKFGSRTELYIAAGEDIECMVRPGDKVKAGHTAVARYG